MLGKRKVGPGDVILLVIFRCDVWLIMEITTIERTLTVDDYDEHLQLMTMVTEVSMGGDKSLLLVRQVTLWLLSTLKIQALTKNSAFLSKMIHLLSALIFNLEVTTEPEETLERSSKLLMWCN